MRRALALMGCVAAVAAVDCEGASDRYYSVDGTCNNLLKPEQGKKGAIYSRGIDGVNSDRVMEGWPNVRLVSNTVHKEEKGEAKMDVAGLNVFAVFFGQFITHDVAHNELRPLSNLMSVDLTETGEHDDFPAGYFAVESLLVEDEDGTQQNLNGATSYLDLSQVYGHNEELAADLRSMEGGLLKTSKELLDREGLTFKYNGQFFPLCHKCEDTSTSPPTPFDPIRVLPGLQPYPSVSRFGHELPTCFAMPCFEPKPAIKCEVNPLWANRSGIYRDIHYTMQREWLPVKPQVPSAKADPLIVAGMNESDVFVTGDARNIENVNLLMMHGMFLRRHNLIARTLAAEHPDWTDEELYQEARLQNIHEYQHIIFSEYLPALLGRAAPGRAKCYDEEVDASISNLFGTAAFRLHTAVPESIQLRYKNGDLQTPENGFDYAPLSDNSILSNSPQGLVNNELGGAGQIANAVHARSIIAFSGGEDAILKSLLAQPANAADAKVTEPLRTIGVNIPCDLPGLPLPFGGLVGDLSATAILRSRVHGIPLYDEVRKLYNPRGSVYRTRFCSLNDEEDSLKCFRYVTGEETKNAPLAAALKKLYKKVNRIDTYTALLAERRQGGAVVGTTQARIIADQFERLRSGDRLFYTHSRSKKELKEMEETVTLQHLVQSVFDIQVQENAFYVDDVDIVW